MSQPPPVSTTLEVDRIRQMVAQVDGGAPLSAERRSEILDAFESFECWNPFFRLIKRGIQDATARQASDYIRLAKVQNLYLEDVFSAAETCSLLVSNMGTRYRALSEEVLPQIIEFEDFAAEATIFSAVCDQFAVKEDRVACLERLCMLFEKKTHNETQLTKSYEKLLEVDPRNVKALRYFKLIFTQSNEWEEVVGILRTLLDCVTHPQEIFRVAQELAAIYLYQLDMAEEAIGVLDSYCTDSPLDTSTILFDAYHRVGNWAGCLKVLRECLLNVDDDVGRAVLHYKIGGLHEQLGEQVQALDNLQKAAKLWPAFLDAIEGIINIAVSRQDWALLETWLKELNERVQDEKLQGQVKQALTRLKDGLAHVRA